MMMNNNIPQGYKQSPLGVIPQDWEVRRLGEIVSYRKGFAFKSELYSSEGVRIIRISDTNASGIKDVSDPIFIQNNILDKFKDYILKENDIIVQTVGSRPPLYDSMVGKTITVSKKHDGVLLNQNMVALYPKNVISSIIYNALKTKRYIKHIESIVRGNANQVSITLDELFAFNIIIPPLAEQERIAEVLGTWDEAIDKQSQLVKALERRKRALMQQLLTARKRLPNFSDPWQSVKLGELGEFASAGVDKKIVAGEIDIRLLNFLDVYRNDFIHSENISHTVTASSDKIVKCNIKKGDIFFTPSSEVPNDIAISAVAMEDMDDVVYSYHIVRYRLNVDWDLHYKAYAFKTDVFFKQAQKICAGSGQRYVISQEGFKTIEIKIPTKEEQKAIAQILTTADREIELATTKLNALRTQKRALMQQLLTGKKRLKI